MEKVDLVKRDNLAVIVIKNPPMNSLSRPVFRDLKAALDDIKKDDAIKIAILSGAGLFCAGADVSEIGKMAMSGDKKQVRDLLDNASSVFDDIANLGKPVVAAIDSYCLGGGNEIAMACTARIASDQAQFGQPEIKLGIIPGLGGTQRLPRMVDLKKALQLVMIGNFIPAKEAKEIGLVDDVVPAGQLKKKAKEFAENLLKNPIQRKERKFKPEEVDEIVSNGSFQGLMKTKSQPAVAAIVDAVKKGIKLPLKDALKLELDIFSDLVVGEDAKEGLKAFFEKRSPKFPSLAAMEKAKPKPEPKPAAPVSQDKQELEMLRKTIRDFAKKEVEPYVEEMEKEERIKPEILKKMGQLGFYGVSYPEKYGGSEFGKTGYCIIFEELSRVHGSLGVVAGAHVGIASGPIEMYGTEEQKQKYLVPAIEGTKIGAFALTEPEAGSDAANVQTTAVKKGDKWIINGSKQFITNGDFADFIVMIAQTDKFLGLNGLVAFIIEKNYPGFEVTGHEDKIGIRASTTASLSFSDMEVPEENMLGEIGQGFKIFMESLNGGRLGLAAGCLGASKAAFEMAWKHASERKQFGKTLVEHEVIQFYFAEMRADIEMMDAAIYAIAERADQGKDYRLEAAILKLKCSEMSGNVVDKALQIHGGYGYIEDYPIARLYRDARINRIFEGTSEIQKLMIFKEVFKSGGKIF